MFPGTLRGGREQLPHLIREQGVPHSCPSRKPGREQYVLSEKPQEAPRGATPLGPAPGPPPAGAAGLTSAHAPAQTASCSPSVKGVFPVTSLAPSSLGQTASLHGVKGGAGSNSTYKKDHRGSFLSVSLWWAVRGGELGCVCVCALSQDQSNICRTGTLLGGECRGSTGPGSGKPGWASLRGREKGGEASLTRGPGTEKQMVQGYPGLQEQNSVSTRHLCRCVSGGDDGERQGWSRESEGGTGRGLHRETAAPGLPGPSYSLLARGLSFINR